MPLSIDFLKSLPYLKDLDHQTLGRFAKEILELSCAGGETVFLEGEACAGLYVLKSGRVRVFKTSIEGREQVLFIARPGDTLGHVPVFDGGPNPASARTITQSVFYLVPTQAIMSLIADCPPAAAIIKDLATRLRHLTLMVENLSFRTVVGRLAKLLLSMAVVHNDNMSAHRLTQDEMAAIVGSVRDVVGRSLKQLEDAGAISVRGNRIVILAPDKLKDVT